MTLKCRARDWHTSGGCPNSPSFASTAQVTDAGLADLKRFTNLLQLDLRDSQITDAGLEHLSGMRNLSYVVLNDDQVTDAGVKDLKQALPSLTIEY